MYIQEIFARLESKDLKTKHKYFESLDANTQAWLILVDILARIRERKPAPTADDVKAIPWKNKCKSYTTHLGMPFFDNDCDRESLIQEVVEIMGKSALFDVLATLPHVDLKQRFKSDEDAIAVGRVVMGKFYDEDSVKTWYDWTSDTTIAKLCFSGAGQYYVKGVSNGGLTIDGVERVPKGAAYAVDLSQHHSYSVREGLERMGAAAYFDADLKLLGVYWCDAGRLVTPDNADAHTYEHAKAIFRATLFTRMQVKEHLGHSHLMVSNSLLVASERCLSSNHPLRRFVKPHTFSSTTANWTASKIILGYDNVIARIVSTDEEGFTNMALDAVREFQYESLAEHFINANLPASMLTTMPMYQDGIDLWNVHASYAEAYVNLIYPTEDLLQRDSEAKDFWKEVNERYVSSRQYGLPKEISKVALVHYLSHTLWWVTGGHGFFGGIAEYVLSGKDGVVPRMFLDSNECTVQAMFQMLVLTTLTSFPSAQLINDWSHLHDYAPLNKHPMAHAAVLGIVNKWQNDLISLSKTIGERNASRTVKFSRCDPAEIASSVAI